MNDLTPKASLASRIQTVRSSGGIEAWLIEDYTVPLISLECAFLGGAAQDPAGKAGVASMLAGLLDEGAGPYDSTAFHERLDDFAIEVSFGSDRDGFSGHLRTLIRHKAEAFDMLKLALNEPRFDEEPLERVRAQLVASVLQDTNDPDAMANRAWFTTAFPGHPYGNPSRGSLETLAAITRDDLIDYKARILAHDTLKIAVVGAIDAASLSIELDKVFGPLPKQSRRVAIPRVTPQGVGTRKIVDLDIPQSSVRFGAAGISNDDPDWHVAIVLNQILGGGVFSSRLFREVREKRGLAYSVSSSIAPFDFAPLHMGGTSTKNERVAESLSIIEAEITSLAKDGPFDEELDVAKKYLTGSYLLRFDTSQKLASQLVQIQIDHLGQDYMDRRNGLISSVTREEAARVAKRLYGEGKLLVTIVGRPVGIDAVKA